MAMRLPDSRGCIAELFWGQESEDKNYREKLRGSTEAAKDAVQEADTAMEVFTLDFKATMLRGAKTERFYRL